jgi:hypothetical protein
MLYEITPDATQSTLDLAKPKTNPHVDGIVGSTQTKVVDLAMSQMQKITIQQPVVGSASGSTIPSTHSSDIYYVQMKNSKGPQQLSSRNS